MYDFPVMFTFCLLVLLDTPPCNAKVLQVRGAALDELLSCLCGEVGQQRHKEGICESSTQTLFELHSVIVDTSMLPGP